MPELDISIGGRSFQVACQPGEEAFLRAAAALLDAEAAPLAAQAGRMPESRLLLMAGLMLADRFAGIEEQLRHAEGRLRDLESRPAPPPERVEVPVEVRVEIPVVPQAVLDRLASMTAEAEALAQLLEDRAGALADAAADEQG
ncbi:cell division protein ZapA [Gemmobacter sp.]|uniref:cell division protein ZapA n=1 Tax=Gemmobacter sp. TaxID=1898957 RepID=UPI002AFE9E29|nr:cell division protein ZapA [Gemmobacter sp.]